MIQVSTFGQVVRETSRVLSSSGFLLQLHLDLVLSHKTHATSVAEKIVEREPRATEKARFDGARVYDTYVNTTYERQLRLNAVTAPRVRPGDDVLLTCARRPCATFPSRDRNRIRLCPPKFLEVGAEKKIPSHLAHVRSTSVLRFVVLRFID